jgi:uncharacterized Zn finger protein
VRNGSVIDLAIEKGKVSALVSGSDLYRIEIGVQPLKAAQWKNVVKECGGKIDSLIELLQGRLSQAVMQVVTRKDGLFPTPREITFRCSCPDSASMCKHIAATLYGIGARLDHQPELLFQLRHVDPQDLIQHAPSFPAATGPADSGRQLADSDLSKLFGIEIDDTPAATDIAPARAKAAAKRPMRTKPVKGATAAKPKTAEPRAAAAARTRRIKKVLIVKVLSRRKPRGRKPKSG